MEDRGNCYIRAVMPLKGHRLFMEMESGSTVTVDLSSQLRTIKYGLLEDMELFNNVRTDGDYVIWGDRRVSVSVKELMDVVLMGEI